MNSRKFFAYVWRINGVVFLVVGILAVGVLATVGFQIVREATRTRHVDNVANTMVGEVADQTATLGEFAKIEGTEVVRAPLTIAQTYALGVASKEADSIRNYLFVDVKSRTSHWLLPSMDKIVLRDQSLPFTEYGEKKEPVRAVVYTIVDEDSDKDGRLTARDHKTLAIAGPDGMNVRRVAEGIDEFNMAALTTPTVVTLLYSKGGALWAAKVDLNIAVGSIESYEIKAKGK